METTRKDRPSSSKTPKKDHLKNPSHPYTFEHLHNAYITSLSHGSNMPLPSKKRKSAINDDSDVDVSTTKRGKGASGSAFVPSSKPQVDSDGNSYWEISKARRVTLSEFKGKKLVNIREYYEKDKEWLPGKKVYMPCIYGTCESTDPWFQGISMSIEQYSAFVQIMPQIENVLKSQGEKVPRPNYDGSAPTADDGSKPEDAEEDEEMDRKPNIEATSDEDE
ncbi:putative RNA polymerase II transcriptional coactivator [Fonsecaea pedrosoi]|nr:putative RNA polymerase II transcriptional coactivator [Fonsecaea pedrosoi]